MKRDITKRAGVNLDRGPITNIIPVNPQFLKPSNGDRAEPGSKGASGEGVEAETTSSEGQKDAKTPDFPRGIKIPREAGTVVNVPPESLTEHPAIKFVPGLNRCDSRELLLNIEKLGRVLVPITVNSKWQILDGCHRNRFAKICKFKTVPVIVDDSLDPIEVAMSSSLARRNLTPSGRALLIFNCHPEIQNGRGKTAGLRKGTNTPKAEVTMEQLEDQHGVPRQYLSKLVSIRTAALKNKNGWEKVQQGILSGDRSINDEHGALVSGPKGGAYDRSPEKQWERLVHYFRDLPNRFQPWDRFSDDQRREAAKAVCDAVEALPPEITKGLAALLNGRK